MDLTSGDILGAGRAVYEIKQSDYSHLVEADIATMTNSSVELSAVVRWLVSEDASKAKRADLGVELVETHQFLSDEIRPWLGEHIADAYRSRCDDRLEDLDAVDNLDALTVIETDCNTIITYSSDTDSTAKLKASLGVIEDRRTAIKRSPAYRTEAALAACREFRTWADGIQRKGRSLQRQGKYDEYRRLTDRAYDEVQRKERALAPHLEYLRQRMSSLSSYEARANLARRTQDACE